MAEIKWADCYSVGVKSMDEQHKKLIEMINSMQGKYDAGVMFDVVMQMFNYAAEHFHAEEALLRKHSYNGLDHQIQEHKLFLHKASEFAGKNLGHPVTHREVTSFLADWLTHHILHEDMQYRNFLSLHDDDEATFSYTTLGKL